MDPGILTDTELSLLLKRARSGASSGHSPASLDQVVPYDFQSAGQLAAAQLAKLSEVHVHLPAQLTRSLSNLLGSECTATLMGVEQIGYGELAKRMQQGALFGTVRVQSPETEVFLHAELATVFPMIDLMLGGAGNAAEAARPLTDIEQEIFKPVVDLLAAELQTIWAPLVKSSPRFAYHGAAEDVIPAGKQVLAVNIEIHFGEFHGVWNLILSLLLSSALIRTTQRQAGAAENDKAEGTERRLRERLLDSQVRLELALPPTTVSVRMLARLKEGQVVVLKQRASDPIQASVEGVHLFQASPVGCGDRRGAQIKKTFPLPKNEEKR